MTEIHGVMVTAITDIDMLYLTDREWDPEDEHGLAWNDPTLALGWDTGDPILSERDRSNPRLDWHDIPEF